MKLFIDENVNGHIVKALFKQRPNADIVRAYAVGLHATPDPVILEWAAINNYVVLTKDNDTMIGFAYARVQNNQPMPGMLTIPKGSLRHEIVESLIDIIDYSYDGEYNMKVEHLPVEL